LTRRIIALTAALFLFAACSSAAPTPVPSSVPSSSVVAAFAAAGLEATSPTPMTTADFGLAPRLTTDGTHFLLPSLCATCGGRVLSFTNVADLHTTKAYYDSLGAQGTTYFSWTFANEGKLVLVQINGELPQAQAAKYGAVVSGL